MKDDQRKGEGLRSDDDGGDDGLSFLLGLVLFSMVVVIISLSSVWGLGSFVIFGACGRLASGFVAKEMTTPQKQTQQERIRTLDEALQRSLRSAQLIFCGDRRSFLRLQTGLTFPSISFLRPVFSPSLSI